MFHIKGKLWRPASAVAFALVFAFAGNLSAQVQALEETGFQQIFDGKSLNGWGWGPEILARRERLDYRRDRGG